MVRRKKGKKKIPLPDGILRDKEFARLLRMLFECRSPDPEKARQAQEAALEFVTASAPKGLPSWSRGRVYGNLKAQRIIDKIPMAIAESKRPSGKDVVSASACTAEEGEKALC